MFGLIDPIDMRLALILKIATLIVGFRRCPIFLASLCAWRRFVGLDLVEYHVRWRLVLVLVHYASRVPIAAVPEQYRGLSLSHCGCLHSPFGDFGGISAWSRIQCVPSHGTLLFHVRAKSSFLSGTWHHDQD